jgi:uncharacterized protein
VSTVGVASPCVSVCRMDEASGLCQGCLRTLDEIAVWSLLDDAEKLSIIALLPRRRIEWRRVRPLGTPDAGGAS